MQKIAFFIASIVLTGCATQKPIPQTTTPSATSVNDIQLPSPVATPVSYADRIRAAIKRHIYYPQSMIDSMGKLDNPQTEVEVTTAQTGEIIAARLIKSSGVRTWDESVLRAVHSAHYIPLDENGKVPRVLVLAFRPRY